VLQGSIQIAVDYAVGRLPSSPVAFVSFESGNARQVALGMDRDGLPAEIASDGTLNRGSAPPAVQNPGISSPGPGIITWRRLAVSIEPGTGAVDWQVHDTSGAQTAAGRAMLRDPATATIDTVCFLSPQGAPSGWLAIDDLVVGG
jgi:hypothetical protein